MKTTLSRFLAALLLLSCGYYSAVAQNTQNLPDRTARRAYYQTNVLPAVRQQRQKLDAQLSTDDKALLATYRIQLRDVHQRGQALRQSLRAATPGAPRPELTEAQRQQLQQLRTEGHAIMTNVAQLAQKYQAPISQLVQELQPRQQKWTADLQAIAAKNTPADQPQRPGHPASHGPRGALSGLTRPVRFLLLDPTAPAPAEPAGLSSTAFPNPAVGAMQLEYTVKKAGPVTVEVLDGRGTVLRTVMQGQPQEKGAHTVTANVGELPAGTYFYKISTRTGVETKRFVKQ
jgi:hypothetical protein